MTDQVGIRELKINASAIIRRVAAGEVIEITSRGHPVARIVPAAAGSPYERMVREGRITPARGSILDYEPLPPVPGRPTGSEALAELRSDER